MNDSEQIKQELFQLAFDIKSLLSNKNKTLSLAESCTGGGISSVISSIPGASEYFIGSVVAYQNEVKVKLLEVPYRLIDEYDVPLEIILTIGYQESDGKWDNNGKISPTNDYGEFQINKCNHDYIYEQLGYTTDDLLYDSVKNAEAAVLLVSNIIKMDDTLTSEEIFGIYNGWTNWREKKGAVRYSKSCVDILCEYFSGFKYGKTMYVKVHR